MGGYLNFGRFGGGQEWGEQDWIVSGNINAGGGTDGYGTVSAGAGWSVIHAFNAPEFLHQVVSDGKFVFAGNVGAAVRQYRWSGSALVQVLDANYGGAGGNTIASLGVVPGANQILCIGQEGFLRGIALVSYQAAPTYSYTHRDTDTGSGTQWDQVHGVRVAAPFTTERPDTFVTFGPAGQTARSYTVSGNTLVNAGSVTIPSSDAHNWRCDPDTGLIVGSAASGNVVRLLQLNMATRALSSLGNSSATGSNVRAVCAIKGMVVVLGTDRTLRSYSISGTTLTLLDSVAAVHGADETQNRLFASPYTGFVYTTTTNTANGKVYHLAENGELTLIESSLGIKDPGSGSPVRLFGDSFLPAPLEVSAS